LGWLQQPRFHISISVHLITRLGKAILAIFVAALLMVPVVILSLAKLTMEQGIAVVCVPIITLIFALAFAAPLKFGNMVAAAAAYSAVIIVFLVQFQETALWDAIGLGKQAAAA
jgi:hypothetical protein